MMNFIKSLMVMVVLSILVSPAVLFAAATKPSGDIDEIKLQKLDIDGIVKVFVSIINYFLLFVALVAVGVIIYSGFLFMTAGGVEDTLNSAKGYLKYGLIGLAVALLAFGVVGFVQGLLSGKT